MLFDEGVGVGGEEMATSVMTGAQLELADRDEDDDG